MLLKCFLLGFFSVVGVTKLSNGFEIVGFINWATWLSPIHLGLHWKLQLGIVLVWCGGKILQGAVHTTHHSCLNLKHELSENSANKFKFLCQVSNIEILGIVS